MPPSTSCERCVGKRNSADLAVLTLPVMQDAGRTAVSELRCDLAL